MNIELTPELEKALLAESVSTGLSPTEIAHSVLASHAAAIVASRLEIPASSIQPQQPIDPELLTLRKAAVERIRALRQESNPVFGPPAGVRFRDWIHEGHQH